MPTNSLPSRQPSAKGRLRKMNGTPGAKTVTKAATATSVAAAFALAVSVTAMSVSIGLWAAAPLLQQRGFQVAAVGGGGAAAVEERPPGSYYPYAYRLEYVTPGGQRLFHIKSSGIETMAQTMAQEFVMAGWAIPSAPADKHDQDAMLLLTGGPRPNLADQLPERVFRFFDVSGGGTDIAYDIMETLDGSNIPDGFLMVGQARPQSGSQAFVIKTERAGNLDGNWPTNPLVFGTPEDEEIAFAVTATADGYLVAGTTINIDTDNHDAWWMRIDRTGNPIGTMQRWGTGDFDEKIFALDRVLNDGRTLDGFILAGERRTKPSPGQAPVSDVLLLRLDQNGTLGGWEGGPDRAIGHPLHSESATAVRQTFSGRGGTPDGFVVSGHYVSQFDGIGQALAMRVDRSGNYTEWNQLAFGGARDDTFAAVEQIFTAAGTPGGFVFAGTSGTTDAGIEDFNVYLVRLDNAGRELWQFRHSPAGGQDIDEGRALALPEEDPRGYRYAVAGKTNSVAIVEDGTVGDITLFGLGVFRRGDADGNEKIDLTDAVFSLNALFQGGPQWQCQDAADANDDGKLDLTDAVFTLNYLFISGPVPPPPGPDIRGPDQTNGDPFVCLQYPS